MKARSRPRGIIHALPMTMPATVPTITERRLRWIALITARAALAEPTDGASLKTNVPLRSAMPASAKLVRTSGGWIAETQIAEAVQFLVHRLAEISHERLAGGVGSEVGRRTGCHGRRQAHNRPRGCTVCCTVLPLPASAP
jgi:hypothetical protein